MRLNNAGPFIYERTFPEREAEHKGNPASCLDPPLSFVDRSRLASTVRLLDLHADCDLLRIRPDSHFSDGRSKHCTDVDDPAPPVRTAPRPTRTSRARWALERVS